MSGKHKKITVVLIIVGAAYAGGGLVSNCLSKRACQRHVAQWLCREKFRGEEFFVPDEATPEMLAILDSVGAKYLHRVVRGGLLLTEDGTYVSDRWPYGYVEPASHIVPFVVTVDWVLEPAYGLHSAGSRRFLCLFGLAVELWDKRSG